MPSSDIVLSSSGVSMAFGEYKVLEDISLNIKDKEIVGILGPNGAGKTTYMNILTGALKPTQGDIQLLGEDITSLDTAKRCHLGLGRTHQVPRPFSHMTVFENILVALNYGQNKHSEKPIDEAWQILEETGLAPFANRSAESLGLMNRKRLELSRTLATKPKVLLLDEIGGGLTDSEGDELVKLITKINARGVTIIWIEHIMKMLLGACTRLVCMAEGKVLVDGLPQDVIKAPEVQTAYFGVVI